MVMENKRIYLKLEKVIGEEVKLEFDFTRDDENYVYIMGYASTPDENSAGFITENKALLDCWKRVKSEGKNIAVYEKHSYPVGKVVACEEMNGKVLVVMEIPRSGNERLIAVYEQDIYVGLSIGGWSLNGEWIDDVYHVTEFDWYEVSLTDIPANENALLLEAAQATKPLSVKEEEEEAPIELEQEDSIKLEQSVLDNILNKIRGN